MLEQHPNYQGIPTPERGINFKHAGYADDTVLGIGVEQDMEAIEDTLRLFEDASGSEVKPLKSFIIWLGPWKPWYRPAYDCSILPDGATVPSSCPVY